MHGDIHFQCIALEGSGGAADETSCYIFDKNTLKVAKLNEITHSVIVDTGASTTVL